MSCQQENEDDLRDNDVLRMYLGDSIIFFQLIDLYSVSSGVVSLFWPRMASISMSPSRFLNHSMAASVLCMALLVGRYSSSVRFRSSDVGGCRKDGGRRR
jgi:hypothetical protein